MRLHGGDLDWLMGKRVEPVLVADEQLQGCQHHQQQERHPHHGARVFRMPVGQQIACADRQHDKSGSEERRIEHMRESIGEARIEDDRPPVQRHGDAIDDLMAGRRVHPAVRRQHPERREHGSSRHGNGREHLQPARHAAPAEQHDAEECGLQEKRRKHLIADQRANNVAGEDREAAPVGAELVGEHDSRHHAHRERHREDAGPEPRQLLKAILSAHDPPDHQRGDKRRQPDGEGREDDVESDRERELQPRQQDGIEFHVNWLRRRGTARLRHYAALPMRHSALRGAAKQPCKSAGRGS